MVTNFERIKTLTVLELAKHNVRECQIVIDNWCEGEEDEYYSPDLVDGFMTSDGKTYEDYEEAFAHEVKWLQAPVKRISSF